MTTRFEPSEKWPALTLEQCEALVCAPGTKFEIETISINGVKTKNWKNALLNIAELVEQGRTHGAREFIVYEGERITFEAWYRATSLLAHYLVSKGVKRGDRIAIAMRNLPEWPVIFFAAACVGAIAVPLNAWWKGEELSYALKDSGASILFCDKERWEILELLAPGLKSLKDVFVIRGSEISESIDLSDIIGTTDTWLSLPDKSLPSIELAPDDDVTILYTSGTTGRPKGAVGTHRNAISNTVSSPFMAARSLLRRGQEIIPTEPRRGLLVIPLFHSTALFARLFNVIAGGHTIYLMYKWDTVKAMQLIQDEKLQSTGGVPTIAWELLDHPDRDKYDLSSLEAVSYGGAPGSPELVRRIKSDFGASPGSGWGMTETSAIVTLHSGEDYLHRPKSCGPPVPVAEMKIMSVDGEKALPIGESGELWVKGPMVVSRYWNNPEATAQTFVEGWIRTGDIARLDEEGFCYIVDRLKDIIIRGGENIYSSEVENILYEHPSISDAAVIGIPEKKLGEIPVAVVQSLQNSTVTEAELQAWVKSRLASFKVPVSIKVQKERLPRNANGKILKIQLRKMMGNSHES